jgi:phosphatidylinositol-bisphosphatase
LNWFKFTEIQRFTIYAATWNVNGQSPNGPLTEWLAPDDDPPDVYAIGFQELDLSKEAFVFNESPKEELWQRAVTAALHPKAKYKQVRESFEKSNKQITTIFFRLMLYVLSSTRYHTA